MLGDNHKELVVGRSPTKRGVFLGEVQNVSGGRVTVSLTAPLKRGDGVVFDRGRPEEPEQGGRVYELFLRGRSLEEGVSSGNVELAFGRHDVDLKQISPGDRVWKTDDPELTRRLRQSFSGSEPKRRVPLYVRVVARVGQPLEIECEASSGARAVVESPEVLAEAIQHSITEELLRAQLGRLGATVYELRSLVAEIGGRPMIPLSVLGKLRREMIEQLEASVAGLRERTVSQESPLAAMRESLRLPLPLGEGRGEGEAAKRHPSQQTLTLTLSQKERGTTLRVLCRNVAQLRASIEAGVAELYADFQDIREYAEAVRRAHADGARLYLATPRIQKPAEGPLFKHLLRHGADGILVRNLGGLEFYAARGVPLVADFSLNAANELTVQLLRERGAQRITASYDLSREQLLDLVESTPCEWLEVVVHQHMPMFHMEHCVFCAVLSPGTNRTNCGRPCDRHEVRLRDRVGMEHPLKADVGCRNTLYNAVPQSAAELAGTLVQRGLRDFRIELLNETPAEVRRTIELYRSLLEGRTTGREVWTRLKALNHVGVTRGPLET
jgi:putative protease